MSIAVLQQTYDELRRLAIAGSDLAQDDFRLKRLIEPLETSAAKAPVFGKVAQAIQNLVESTSQDSARRLLELSTLVTAILYTQGETGEKGKGREIDTAQLGIPTSDASARVLKPLIESLTTTGSGRLEVIQDAHRRGAFRDLRLFKHAIRAIDDVYGEIGDFIADDVLPLYGKAVYGELRSTFDIKGKAGHVRRLRLMHQLDPEATRELVEEALESGSKEIKIAAMACLNDSNESVSYLLEQAGAKNKEVRAAALGSIGHLKNDEVVDTLIQALSGRDLGLAIRPASQNRSPKLLKYLLDEQTQLLTALLAAPTKAPAKKQADRFHALLDCFATRDDKKTDAFLVGCFERRDEIDKVKGGIGGEEINRRVAALLVRTDSKAGQKALVDAHETLEPELLDWSFLAALRTRKPKEVYDRFSPYYLAKIDSKKRGRDPAKLKKEAVCQWLIQMGQGPRNYYRAYVDYGSEQLDATSFSQLVEKTKLDPRWLDAAIACADLDTVIALALPRHKATQAFLAATMDAQLKKKGDIHYELSEVLETMIRVQHPRATEYFVAALKKVGSGRRSYYSYWLFRLIPTLPKTAAPQIEKLVPNLNEKVIDEMVPYLEELKSKS